MRRVITMCLAALALASCATPEQRAANMQAEMSRMMVEYGPACARLGYASNSDPWRSCVLQLSAKEEAERYGYPPYYAGFAHSRWGVGATWGPYW